MLPQKLLQVLRKQPPQKRSKKLRPMPQVPENAIDPDPPADEGVCCLCLSLHLGVRLGLLASQEAVMGYR